MSARRYAQIQVLVSAGMFSTAGLFMGLLHTDIWTILFWRSLFAAVFTACFIALQRDIIQTLQLDRAGLVAIFLSAAATVLFIPSLDMTAVANVAAIHGALPLLTVIVSRPFTREPVERRTIALCCFVSLGTFVIFTGSAFSGIRLLGDGLALLMTTCMAMMTVAFRLTAVPSVLGVVTLSNVLVMTFTAGFSKTPTINLGEGAVLASFALFQMTFGLLLYARGSRQLPPAESAMLSLVEVPFAAFWVWLAFDQRPAPETIAGGGIILIAVLFHLVPILTSTMRRQNRKN
jgi:drug/metabolite transporter (DMT)-like permease